MREYFSIYIKNPFKTWWKAKKVFKMPKLKLSICKHRGGFCAKILDIDIRDISWKWKYDYISYENSPYIDIILFNWIRIYVYFYYKDNKGEDITLCTYETILDYLYNRQGRTIEQLIECNAWIEFGETKYKYNCRDVIKK